MNISNDLPRVLLTLLPILCWSGPAVAQTPQAQGNIVTTVGGEVVHNPDSDIASALSAAQAGKGAAALETLRAAVHKTHFKSSKARYFLAKTYREAALRAASWQVAKQHEDMARQHLEGASALAKDATYGHNAEFAAQARRYLESMRQGGPFSARAQGEMERLHADARSFSLNKSPDGNCFAWVAGVRGQRLPVGGATQSRDGFLTKTAYGKLGGRRSDGRDNWAVLWRGRQGEARDFADHLNGLGGPEALRERYGLRRLLLTNPYSAPRGAIVVVAPGSPGTSHATAGDITVADGAGRFFNGGEMNYGGRGSWHWEAGVFTTDNKNRWEARRGKRFLLGVYVPAD